MSFWVGGIVTLLYQETNLNMPLESTKARNSSHSSSLVNLLLSITSNYLILDGLPDYISSRRGIIISSQFRTVLVMLDKARELLENSWKLRPFPRQLFIVFGN